MGYLAETFPEITSLLYVNNLKYNDTIGDLDVITFRGNDHIYLQMENLRFKSVRKVLPDQYRSGV